MLYLTYSALSKMKRYTAYLSIATGVTLVLFVAYINIDAVAGAFGEGLPYYGRTTNMDKWENPIPLLVAIDVAVLVVVFFIGRWVYRQLK